jgi:hypothetical protein
VEEIMKVKFLNEKFEVFEEHEITEIPETEQEAINLINSFGHAYGDVCCGMEKKEKEFKYIDKAMYEWIVLRFEE